MNWPRRLFTKNTGLCKVEWQSMTDRFHELHTPEREIRLRKRTLLQQLSEDGDKLLEVLQEQQAQLALAESQTADEAQRAAIQWQIQELDTLIRNLEDIQRNPNRFVEGQPADTPPQPLAAPQDWESMPPRARFAARRIQELEQQIRFLRSRLHGLESQVEELKVLMETQSGDMPVGPDFENPELGPRQPLPSSEFPGEGPNRRRFPGPPPGPRRDEIPPAGPSPRRSFGARSPTR